MEIQRYRRKAVSGEVLVQAVCLSPENVGEVANWSNAQLVEEIDSLNNQKFDALNMPTPRGKVRVQLGDFVVCVAGEFVKAAPSEFRKLYEPIGSPHEPKRRGDGPLSSVVDLTTTTNPTANPWEGIPRATQ